MKKRSWRESAELLLAGKLSKEQGAELLEQFGLPKRTDLTQQDQVLAAMIKKAQDGGKDAAAFLRETVGQTPSQLAKEQEKADKTLDAPDLKTLTDQELRRMAAAAEMPETAEESGGHGQK